MTMPVVAKRGAAFTFAALSLTISAGVLSSNAALAQVSDQPKSSFTLSTASAGGAFHKGGVSLSALVKIKLLPEKEIDLSTSNSSGSLENLARIGAGSSDFAIAQALLGHYAWHGTGPAKSLGRQQDLRAVTMLWPNVEHFIVRKDAAPNGSISDLIDTRGQRLSLGREDSAIESNRFLLENLGMDIETDIDQALLGFLESAAAFRRGDLDGLSLPVSTPVPDFVNLIESLGPDVAILNWTDEDLARADGGLGLWSRLTLPPGTYPGQDAAIETIAQPNFLAVRADVDDEVVYAITKVIFENLAYLKRLHKPFQFLTPEKAIAGLPVPLHPGALRYFEEIQVKVEPSAIAQYNFDVFGKSQEGVSAIRDEVRRGVVSLLAPEDGTSDQLVNELLDVFADEEDLRILPLKGRGTAQNLADLLYLSGIDVSVLQADAMEFMRQETIIPGLTRNIRYITKWHDMEVHLLVRDDILRLEQLRDKRVNFGPRGSGSEVTASTLFNRLRLPVEQASFSHETALKKLKRGEIAGMVHVAPKPVPLFERIQVRDGLRLLSLPAGENGRPYQAAILTESDYPTLVFGGRTIETIAVPSVLAAYNWSPESDRYEPIKTFVTTLLANLSKLQDDQRHPKWQDVDPFFDFGHWRRHQASETYLKQAGTSQVIGQGGPLLSSAGTKNAPTDPRSATAEPADAESTATPPARPQREKGGGHPPVF